MNDTKGWYTIVSWGGAYSGGHPMPPRGPWRSWAEADAALARWGERAGYVAGTLRAVHHVRIAGPFATRREARRADVSKPLPHPPMAWYYGDDDGEGD